MSLVRSLAKGVLYRGGFYGHRLRTMTFPGLVVLCYHGVRNDGERNVPFAQLHVTAEQLAEHCALIARHCQPVSMGQVCAAIRGGAALPERAVLVTFDDGYRSVLTRGLPVLRRFGVPAVLFVCSDPIRLQRLHWYEAVARSQGEPAAQTAKYLPHQRWRDACAAADTPARADDPFSPVTVDELRQLAADPLIEIGAHTVTHPILSLAPEEVQRTEIGRCRATLEEWSGRPVQAFAYPNGIPQTDYTARTVDLVREAGFTVAFTTREGYCRPAAAPLECPRFLMHDDVSGAGLAHRLTYSWWRTEEMGS